MLTTWALGEATNPNDGMPQAVDLPGKDYRAASDKINSCQEEETCFGQALFCLKDAFNQINLPDNKQYITLLDHGKLGCFQLLPAPDIAYAWDKPGQLVIPIHFKKEIAQVCHFEAKWYAIEIMPLCEK